MNNTAGALYTINGKNNEMKLVKVSGTESVSQSYGRTKYCVRKSRL